MFSLYGSAPDHDGEWVVDFHSDGEQVQISIHPPESYDVGGSVIVDRSAFRNALRSTNFALAGVSPGQGTERRLMFDLRNDMHITILGEPAGPVTIQVNMDQLRDALVQSGIVADTAATGIETSPTYFRKDMK